MGDRSQIAIKQPTKKDPKAKVYLYSHWGGADVFTQLQAVIQRGQRLYDPEYLSRIIFREIGAGEQGDLGYGIGNESHSDIEHLIPVLDCDQQKITFEIPEWDHNKRPNPGPLTFEQFAKIDRDVFKDW